MHFTRNKNVNTLFSNPEIPGFGLSSRDFGIEKRSGIPGSRIPGLQSLAVPIIIITVIILASCLMYAPKWASANFVDSLCPFRRSFVVRSFIKPYFLKQCTVRQYTTPIHLVSLRWKLGLGLGLDSDLHYFSILHGE